MEETMAVMTMTNSPTVGANRITLELEVQKYAHDLLSDHVVKEYRYVINEWRKYINRVVDAEREAQAAFEKVLLDSRTRQHEIMQRKTQVALLALSIVAGPALSWVAGSIENAIFPKYFSTRNRVSRRILLAQKDRPQSGRLYHMHYNEKEHNNVMAKVFGDSTSSALDRTVVEALRDVIGKIPPRKKGKSFQELRNLGSISSDADSDKTYHSLKTHLENALMDEEENTVRTISDLALEIRRSDNFGRKFVDRMLATFPGLQGADIQRQLNQARNQVESFVNDQRRLWADQWLYFGNFPPGTSTGDMARRMEREIWSVWILDQDFKVATIHPIYVGNPNPPEWTRSAAKGRDGSLFDDIIVDRLVDLGVVLPRTVRQIFNSANRHPDGRQKVSPDIHVRGGVNDARELAAVEQWAEHHPVELLSGTFDRTPRGIPHISMVHTR
jgi:hypothetical protein